MPHQVRGRVTPYPNGGTWGVSLEDDIGRFFVLPGLDPGAVVAIKPLSTEDERAAQLESAPTKARAFILALLALKHAGMYFRLQDSSFTFSLKGYRTRTSTEINEFFAAVCQAFEEAYGVDELTLAWRPG